MKKYSAIRKLLDKFLLRAVNCTPVAHRCIKNFSIVKAYIGRYNYLQLKKCAAFEIKYYCKVFNYEKGKSGTCCT